MFYEEIQVRATFARSVFVVVSVVSIISMSRPAIAQESRAVVVGRVTDSTGATVPDAAVSFTNNETAVTIKTRTNGEGSYFSSFLNPGSYRIVAEKQGFKKLVRSGITLAVNDRLELNLSLEVGSQAESIVVTADANLIDTGNPSVGRVISSQEVLNLPIHLGDVDNIIRLGNGVAFTDQPAKDQPWQPLNSAYAMAGSPSNRNEYTLDGASNTDHDEARGTVAQAWSAASDVVAEFKVQTSAFDVSTGQTEGGVVNVVLKSGTNQLHGSAYIGKEITQGDANLFFSNASGQPRQNLGLTNPGGYLSGPVIAPKIYNGRNRTFFLFGYNWDKSVASGGTAGGVVASVPTAAERTGDFSALLKLGSVYQIYNPFSRVPAAGGIYSSTPVPGNMIPSSQLNPVALKLLSYYPLPEQVGTPNGENNLDRSNWPSRVIYHSMVLKFDQNISDRNRIMLRLNTNRNDNHSVDYFGFDNPSEGAVFWQKSLGFAFAENYSFSPSLIMDVRLSDSGFVRAQGPNAAGAAFSYTAAGFPAYVQKAIPPSENEFPTVTIPGYTTLGDRSPLYKDTETRSASVTSMSPEFTSLSSEPSSVSTRRTGPESRRPTPQRHFN